MKTERFNLYPCNKCGGKVTTRLARLCDECFEIGKQIEPPRQTGRTFQLIKEMDKNKEAVLVVHNYAFRQHLETYYPWLHGRIKSVHDDPYWMRGRTGGVLVDHCVTEFWSKDTNNFMLHYRMIQPPEKPKKGGKHA